MSEKTPFWKQPQNYIIAILLLGITGYIGYQQLQPKTNKLAQASAYFDAIDAEERAEAEKKRAAEEKEKARLAAIEMEKAKEEARVAQQKAKEAEDRARQERAAREALAYMRSSNSASNQDTRSDESPSYEYKATYSCSFCCAGQFGNCRSSRITVQTTTAELWEAQQFIRDSYAEQCAQFPFYSGGGGSASVDNFNCDLK